MGLRLNGSTSGYSEIAAPAVAGDQTFTLPATGGDLLIKADLNASGNAPTYAARAWVNFNGTGTVAIRSSGNVSSITDNGTGNYTVNFATAMEDADYAPVSMAEVVTTRSDMTQSIISRTTSAFQLYVGWPNGVKGDSATVSVVVFR